MKGGSAVFWRELYGDRSERPLGLRPFDPCQRLDFNPTLDKKGVGKSTKNEQLAQVAINPAMAMGVRMTAWLMAGTKKILGQKTIPRKTTTATPLFA